MPSMLAELLEQTKAKRKHLEGTRNYMAAKQLVMEATAAAKESKQDATRQREQHYEVEKKRLSAAKKIALHRMHQAVSSELRDIEHRWEEKGRRMRFMQAQRLNAFQDAVFHREHTKPVVLSGYVRDLLNSERKLAEMQVYDEAEQVRRKIQKQEHEEHQKLIELGEERVQSIIERKVKQLDTEQSFFQVKKRNEIALAKFRAAEEETRLRSLFAHLEKDLAHAHTIRAKENPLVAAISVKHLPVPPKAMTSETRGTYYFHRVHGCRFDIPSLCDLYAKKMDLWAEPSPPKTAPPRARFSH